MKKSGKFAAAMLKVGVIGFGGGSALIPVIEKEFVTDQRLETKKNYDRDVLVASLTPGALPVELASSIGLRCYGCPGMILGAVCMALPGAAAALAAIALLSVSDMRVLTVVDVISVAVSAYILYLLAKYVQRTLEECRRESIDRHKKAVLVILSVFLLTCGNDLYALFGIDMTPVFGVSTIHILICAFFFAFYTRSVYSKKNLVIAGGLCGVYLLGCGQAQVIQNRSFLQGIQILMLILAVCSGIMSIRNEDAELQINRRAILKELGVWLLFLMILCGPAVLCGREGTVFAGRGFLSSLMSFGGGDAYLTIADSLFVDTGMISAAIYYGQVVAVVNILPGSILCKTLTAIGYCVGYEMSGTFGVGVLFAAAGFGISIAASCGCYQVVWHVYDSIGSFSVVKTIGRWIRPIIAGLLMDIALSLCRQSQKASEYLGISDRATVVCVLALTIADSILIKKCRCNPAWMLLANLCAVFGIFMMGIGYPG